MNRIVLIGNGFDLAHGLPTRYEDFIDDYWSSFVNEALKKTRRFEKECVTLNLGTTNTTLNNIAYSSPPKSFKILSEMIDNYNNSLMPRGNNRVRLDIDNGILKRISENESLYNWVDIENEFYKFLCYPFDSVRFNSYNYDSINKLNQDFDYIKQKLNDYLNKIIVERNILRSEKIQEIIYSSFFIGEFTEDAKKDIIAGEIHKIEEYKKLLNPEIIHAKTIGLLHLQPDVNEELLTMKTNEKNFWDMFFDLQPDDIMFLNFNYTNLEVLYIDKEKPVNHRFIPLDIHIHGELNNPINPVIFGYGDEIEENYSKLENLQDNAYLENIKSIKYQETDNYKQMLNFVNSDKYQIIILGHSCGNSDRTLLKTLFEHENCVSIKPYYYQYEEEGVKKDNYSDIVRNISRSFTDKKSMRDKVVNKTYTDWFSEHENK